MKILIDQNNLLTIDNPNIPKLKEYPNIASGYKFSDYDKWIVVYHKKEIKIVNLKNLWDSMNIFYITKRESLVKNHLDQNWFTAAFGLFNWFDENTGKKYSFVPRMKESEMKILNETLEKLWIDIILEKNEKGIVTKNSLDIDINIPVETEKIISFLFALILIYGKLDIKNEEIIWVKAHIPLFGQYSKYKDELDSMIKNLQDEWIFLSSSIVQNWDWIIYQINSSDYELLGSFVNFYQSVEKIQKILKQELAKKVKSDLISFIEINEQIPEDWKEDVLKIIEDGVIKLLIVW